MPVTRGQGLRAGARDSSRSAASSLSSTSRACFASSFARISAERATSLGNPQRATIEVDTDDAHALRIPRIRRPSNAALRRRDRRDEAPLQSFGGGLEGVARFASRRVISATTVAPTSGLRRTESQPASSA